MSAEAAPEATNVDVPRASVSASSGGSIIAAVAERVSAEAAPEATNVDVSVPPSLIGARSVEFKGLLGEPGTQRAADGVRPSTLLDTIAHAARPEERAAVRAHFAAASSADRAAAFERVLEASTTVGARSVTLGPFVGHVSVSATGEVNGHPLPSDAELEVTTTQLTAITQDDRKAQLRQVGASEAWLAAASGSDVVRAFNHVELERRFAPSGAVTVDLKVLERSGRKLEFRPREQGGTRNVEFVETAAPAAQLSFSVTADRKLVHAGRTEVAPSVTAMQRVADRENAEWPSGPPEARVVTTIEASTLEVPRNDKINTILALVPAAASLLLHGKVSDSSFESAYQAVLALRRGGEGTKTLAFSLTPVTEYASHGDGGSVSGLEEAPPVAFSVPVTVGPQGAVNGARLMVDDVAQAASELSTIAPATKDQALKDLGASEEFLGNASAQLKDYALARARVVARTGEGPKTLDFEFVIPTYFGSDAGEGTTMAPASTRLSFTVGAGGKINGAPSSIEVALNTQLTMEKLPMAEKRAMLGAVGMPAELIRGASPQGAADLLARLALATRTPGEQQFEMTSGGVEYIVGVKVGASGQIEGAGAVVKPPPPPKEKWYKKVLGPVLTIASFAFPSIAPVLQVINGLTALKSGVKGLGLVAALAGTVSGVSTVLGSMATTGTSLAATAASVASTAGTIASTAGALNGVRHGLKTGDFLGTFSSVVSLASQFTSSGTGVSSEFDLVRRAGVVAGIASRAINGDVMGAMLDTASAIHQHERSKVQPSPAAPEPIEVSATFGDLPDTLPSLTGASALTGGQPAPADDAPADAPADAPREPTVVTPRAAVRPGPVTTQQIDERVNALMNTRAENIERFLDTGEIVPPLTSVAPPQDGTQPIGTVRVTGGGEYLVKSLMGIAAAEGFAVSYVGTSSEAARVARIDGVEVATSPVSDAWGEDNKSVRDGVDLVVPFAVGAGSTDDQARLFLAQREQRLLSLGVSQDAVNHLELSGAPFLTARPDDPLTPFSGRESNYAAVGEALALGKEVSTAYAFVDGGNALVGGRGDGRFVIVGEDAVLHTQNIVSRQVGAEISREQALALVAADFGVGRVIPIEQPGDFHVDMRMALNADGSVVLNDAVAAGEVERDLLAKQFVGRELTLAQYNHALDASLRRENRASEFEAIVTAQLKEQGVTVHRLAGAFTTVDPTSLDSRGMPADVKYNFLNIEQGVSPKDGQRIAIALGGPPEMEAMVAAAYAQHGVARVHFLDRTQTAHYSATGAANCLLKVDPPKPPGP